MKKTASEKTLRIRLDKWLWAARFFKTRPLAQAAIEGGKVHYAGQRVKCSHLVQVDAIIRIQFEREEKIVRVLTLAERRGNAQQAALLYEETAESLIARTKAAEEYRLLQGNTPPATKPDKKQRRQIIRFIRPLA